MSTGVRVFPRLISRGLIEAMHILGMPVPFTGFPRLISRGLIEAVLLTDSAVPHPAISATDQSRPH